ncbi:hypothetical protein B0H13DRAFT_2113174 [Mycena leptocephala]|nr:hypothetical protein B0H13DRAFT_2113174 [Mycena leptocephala]
MDTDTTSSASGVKTAAGVIQMTNGQQYTAPPPDGFPMPQGMDSPWKNTTPLNRATWAEMKAPKAWVRVYRAKYSENARDTVSKLGFVIKRLVNAPTVVIAPPTANEGLGERLPAPWNFLLSSIPKESLKRLTDQGLWSTPTITFFVIPFDAPTPNYIMTLQNLTANDDEEGAKFVARIVRDKLKSIKEASEFVVNHSSKDDEKAATTFLDTIFVTPLEIALPGGGTDVVFNIYCVPPPSLSFSDFLKWTSSARNIRYDTASHGSGVARTGRDQLFCVGCKGYDHPTGLCPILRIIGIFLSVHKLTADDDTTLQKSDECAAKKARVSKPKTDRSGNKGGRKSRR